MRIRTGFLGSLVLGLAIAGVAGSAQAGVLIEGGTSLEGRGSFTGSINVLSTDLLNRAAILTITLTHTSPTANAGYLTAFAFNNPGNIIKGITLIPELSRSINKLVTGKDNVNAAPFGKFDYAVTIDKKANKNNAFEGGGKPSLGISTNPKSNTETFRFLLTGKGVGHLTAEDFTTAMSTSPGAGQGSGFLAVRFRGFADGGSDKVSAAAVVPEPSTTVLAMAALLPLGLVWWRRRSAPISAVT